MSGKSLPSQRTGNQTEQRKRTSPRRGAKAAVLVYFHERPGVSVFLKDLMKDLGLDERQVQSAISLIRREDENSGIENLVRGQEWVYKPNGTKESTQSGEQLYRRIGQTKNGTILLESEDGVIGKFIELD